MITVTIWHNVAHDAEGRHIAMLDGYQPGDPVVAVFAYQADPAGRAPEVIADEAFAICNDHPHDARGEELSRRYYARELRSLSFPGKRPCCPRSCCVAAAPRGGAVPEMVPVWAYLDSTCPAGLGPAVSASRAACQAGSPG
jgi:hypothetical protein